MKKVTRFAAAMLLFAVPVEAIPPEPASPPPAPDKMVKGLSEAVFLQLYESFGTGSANPFLTQKLQTAIRADNVVDAAEADLLSELIQVNVYTITIEPPSDAYRRFYVYPTVFDNKRILRQTLRPLPELRAALDGGADGWKRLVATYNRDDQGKSDAIEVMVDRLIEPGKSSNRSNLYQPFRDALRAYSTFSFTEDGGRDYLHAAAAETDKELGGGLPDYLFDWLKPAATP